MKRMLLWHGSLGILNLANVPYFCFSKDEPDWRIADMAQMGLVFAELQIDKWTTSRARAVAGSPHK